MIVVIVWDSPLPIKFNFNFSFEMALNLFLNKAFDIIFRFLTSLLCLIDNLCGCVIFITRMPVVYLPIV